MRSVGRKWNIEFRLRIYCRLWKYSPFYVIGIRYTRVPKESKEWNYPAMSSLSLTLRVNGMRQIEFAETLPFWKFSYEIWYEE